MIPLEQVYKEYSDMIYRWLLARTGDPDVAEEITQETFYQAVLHADAYDYSCKVSTWLCSIASNKLKEYYRKNPPKEDFDTVFGGAAGSGGSADSTLSRSGYGSRGSAEEPSVPGPEAAAVADAEKLALYRAIHSLPEPSREVVQLRAFSDLSFKEIGDIFGKTETWARVTFYRAKTALKKELTENE